jgi:DNA-nicking Smr family endonuclease
VNENPPSSKRVRRQLSAAELELWLDATRSVARKRAPRPPQSPQPKFNGEPERSASSSAKSLEGATTREPSREAAPRPRPAPLDPRLRQRLSRGQAAPDAKIDLHGMRREEAFVALRSFLMRAQNDGARLILIVTGKGSRPAQVGATPGILRRCVPQWLCAAQYQSIVAGFEEAARPHGGAGALYVRLRRRSWPGGRPII